MKIELVQNEDLTVKTKTGSTVTVPSPSADDTLATISDLEAIQFKEWFPGGEAKSIADCTSGLKFDWAHADSTNRTVSVLPFCNTGDSANDNSDKTGRVIIPPHVDHDGSTYMVVGVAEGYAANENAGLTSIVAPTTVTTIGTDAFGGCNALVSVSLPAATTIGVHALGGCNALTSVSLPAATTIGANAFDGCDALTSVSLPAATTIGANAFDGCDALTSVSLPVATDIVESAFYNCTSLTSVSLPAATTIGANAFGGCDALTSVSLPAATTIGENVFSGCDALTSVSLPAAISIGGYAFSGCYALSSVSLPAATSIGDYTFYYCLSLSSVSFPAATTIGENVFSGCDALTSVSLPAAISIGGYAFSGCYALSSVDFGPTARQYVPTLGTDAFDDLSQSGHTCRIVVPDSQFAEWTADADWVALTSKGYEFVTWSSTQPATKGELANKQDIISDLDVIRAGAASGATSVQLYQRNLLDYTTNTTLAADAAVYRFSADMNGTSASIPSLVYTGIPTIASYYCFELEVYVPDTATSLTGPTTSSDPPWIWIPGGELPTYGYAGKTVFIACRMDCASRKVMANCYLVGDSIKVDPVGMETLALAASVTPTDSTTVNSIQAKLGLSDTNTIQDAANAVS